MITIVYKTRYYTYCNSSLADDDFAIKSKYHNSISSCFNLYPGFQDANLGIVFYFILFYFILFYSTSCHVAFAYASLSTRPSFIQLWTPILI